MQSERWFRTETILLTAGLLLSGYLVGEVLLLVSAAVILSVGLDGLARVIAGRLPLSRGWALTGALISITAIILAVLGLTATRLVQQFRELTETVLALWGVCKPGSGISERWRSSRRQTPKEAASPA